MPAFDAQERQAAVALHEYMALCREMNTRRSQELRLREWLRLRERTRAHYDANRGGRNGSQ